jgi:hypothetical protein
VDNVAVTHPLVQENRNREALPEAGARTRVVLREANCRSRVTLLEAGPASILAEHRILESLLELTAERGNQEAKSGQRRAAVSVHQGLRSRVGTSASTIVRYKRHPPQSGRSQPLRRQQFR